MWSRGLRTGLPWELLRTEWFTSNWSPGNCKNVKKFTMRREGVESWDLRVNATKRRWRYQKIADAPVWMRGFGRVLHVWGGTGGNCILCIVRGDPVHKRYSGVTDSLSNVIDVTCSVCRGNQTIESRVEDFDIGNESLQCVDKFCCGSDTLGAEASTTARIRRGWKKFRDLVIL